MFSPTSRICLVAATVAAVLGPSPAGAACSDRPGTPVDVRARLTGTLPPTIEVSWTNTARNDETVFWDVEHTVGVVVFPNPAGIGRGDRGKGLRVSNTYTVDAPKDKPVEHCFKVKARTERGTNGCTSEVWSNRGCATVPVAAQAPDKPTKRLGKRALISVRSLPGDVFRVMGSNFTSNAPVTIDVSGDATTLKSITVDRNNAPIVADAKGSFSAMLGGVCNSGRSGTVRFVARDKEKAPTSPQTATCKSGAEYVPNRKIKP